MWRGLVPRRLPPEECEECGGTGFFEEADDQGNYICRCEGL